MTQTRDTGPPTLSSPNGSRDLRPSALSVPVRAPMRARRRPALVAMGIALAAAGGVLTATVVAHTGSRVAVLAVTRAVPVGSVITRADLTVARETPDSNLSPVPAAQESNVVGQVAAVALLPGTLLIQADITTATVPGAGQELVGVALGPGQLPGRPLVAGMRVLVVATPGEVSGPATGRTPSGAVPTIAAVVVDVGTPESNGTVVVDLSVASAQGPALAAIASTGRVALVEQSAGG